VIKEIAKILYIDAVIGLLGVFLIDGDIGACQYGDIDADFVQQTALERKLRGIGVTQVTKLGAGLRKPCQ
jgi:hypothetical protein